MQLSSELFERIIGPHGSSAAPEGVCPLPMADETGELPAPAGRSIIMPAGARVVERRQVRRTRFGQRARMCLEPEVSIGIWDKVMLQDISVAGVSFLSDRWLDVNALVQITIEDRTGAPIRLRCLVRRCERGGMGGVCYTVGATFEALLTHVPGGVEAGLTETVVVSTAADTRLGPPGGLLGRFKPRRLLSAFTRNYDDYSTVSLGHPPGAVKSGR